MDYTQEESERDELLYKLENLGDYKPITVADLTSLLAGLPPMMEVFVNEEGKARFLNGGFVYAQVRESDKGPVPAPIFILSTSVLPLVDDTPVKDYDEQMAEQRQRAMQMGRNSQQAQQMPEAS